MIAPTTAGWHLDDHQITITLDWLGAVRLTAECAVDGQTATANDPCRVDYDEDGTVIAGSILRYCNFTSWFDGANADLIELLHPKATPWPVGACPMDIAVRWEGDGYEWAPRRWVAATQAGDAR